MTQTIQLDNPNLMLITSEVAIYFTSEDFLLENDTLIIQEGRKNESAWNVNSVQPTQSKAVKPNFSIAHLSLNK